MESLWNDAEAAQCSGPLGLRVYSSRLLGRDKSLVLHGGGNTSVKLRQKNLFGEDDDVLYVKGSGCDLETIEAADFAPLPLGYLQRLAGLADLPDAQLMNELATRKLSAAAPAPSVETLLHAILPHKYVEHTHADAVLSVSNSPDGEQRMRDIYGDKVVVIPYVMAGFELASRCAHEFPRHAGKRTIGMVLLSHGVFSFGAEARESYERMIELVSMAEKHLASKRAWILPAPSAPTAICERNSIAALRRAVSDSAGFPLLAKINGSPKFRAFAARADVARLSQRGPATPDHVIYTKPVPMLGRDAASFAKGYREYFERNAARAKTGKTILDVAPRTALDPQFGFAAFGRTAKDAAIAEELYDHTIDIILRAEALGGWLGVGEQHIFDIEYWDLEQAKLGNAAAACAFAGEIALVTGAASGIGKACAEAFLERGAAVIGLDRNPAIETLFDRADFIGLSCDLTDTQAVQSALDAAVERFGGVDMLVLNAGIFPPSSPISGLADETLRRALAVNVEANLIVMRETYPLLRCAPRGARVVVIGSKNVPAPGPGAGAYSVSKAAMNQLARVAALEWAKDGIRVNTIHPNAVYDTALWTDEVLAARAKAYGLTVAQYKTNNLLKTEVTSRDVAELAAEMCGALFSKTTAAQVPVDGGTEKLV